MSRALPRHADEIRLRRRPDPADAGQIEGLQRAHLVEQHLAVPLLDVVGPEDRRLDGVERDRGVRPLVVVAVDGHHYPPRPRLSAADRSASRPPLRWYRRRPWVAFAERSDASGASRCGWATDGVRASCPN